MREKYTFSYETIVNFLFPLRGQRVSSPFYRLLNDVKDFSSKKKKSIFEKYFSMLLFLRKSKIRIFDFGFGRKALKMDSKDKCIYSVRVNTV